VAQAFTDPNGHFVMHIFVGTPYQLHAVIPGPEALSVPPVDIQPGCSALSLPLSLTQPGNSTYDIMRSRQ
jgi:hypothetical protein